jgi:hypothetical protein
LGGVMKDTAKHWADLKLFENIIHVSQIKSIIQNGQSKLVYLLQLHLLLIHTLKCEVA